MSGVIKSGQASADAKVRTLPMRPMTPVAAPVDPVLAALREELRVLADDNARLEAEVARLTAERPRAREEALSEGRAAGRREAESQAAEALSRLEDGVAHALKAFTADLASLERLAVVLAKESLTRMVGDADARAGLLRDIIRRQVATIDGRSLVRIEVSAEDFPDDAQLAAIAGAGGTRLDVAASSDLGSGDCHMRLVLGGVEIGVNQQWTRLSALLDELAAPELAK